jgi:hypothetical protein
MIKMKYSHTPYFSFSPSASEKDRKESGVFDLKDFLGKRIVITTKRDGSNISLSSEKVAARNGHDALGISFDMAKSLHAPIKHLIPDNIIIFGEWLYASHSIHYTGAYALENYMQLFAAYDKTSGMWLSWEDVTKWAFKLGFITVPNVFGITEIPINGSIKKLEELITWAGDERIEYGNEEGIVVRNTDEFYFDQFKHNVAKYVRANHIQTSQHWSKQPIVKNELL